MQRIAVTQAATWRRRRWRTAELLTDGVPERWSPCDEAGDADTRSMVALRLARVTPRQRTVVVLRFMYDRSVEEVAELVGCSPGTVKSQTGKALAALRASGAVDRLDEVYGRSRP